MRIDTNIFTQHNLARVKEPRFVFEVAFDSANTILGYFTSHADAALPGGGTVIASVLQSFSGTSQTLSPDQANSTIGNLSLSFTDLGRAVTTLLGGQLALGRSTRQQRVRAYMGYKGDVWADYTLIQTQMVTEISYARGAYTIKCQDIQRSLRQNIFVQSKSSLASSVAASELSVSCLAGAAILSVLSAADFPTSGSGTIRDYAAPASDNDAFTWAGKTATTLTGCAGVLAHAAGAVVCDATINVQDTSAFVAVAHGTSYSDAPSATVGYIQIDKEVCRWVSKTSTTFVLDRRGALNTVATAHPVDPVSTLDQRTKAVEYVYLELPALDLIYRILTGKDRFGAAALPVNWNLGVDLAYVRLADFTDPAKLDLWDPADDTQGFVVRFEDLRSQDGKKFIETELALLCGIFMPVYADGSLGCKRMTSVLPGAAYVAQLDESNVVSCGELVYDMTSLHNAIQISWNWEPLQGDFTRVNVFLDQPSITVHKQAPTLKLQFRGLHGSRHSAAMLAGRFDIIRDRYTGPPYRLTTEVLHRFNALEVGDVTRTKLRTVRDFVANGTLDRSFEIQGISIDWMKGLSLKQFASTRAPSPLPATGDATVLTHAWYTSQGTQLVTGVGSLTITGSNPGHVTVGGTLAGNADATNAAAIYYYVGDLVIDPGVTVNLTQNAQLRVEGSLTVNGVLNGIGGGLPGATQPSAFTTNADMSATVLGAVGFLGTTYAQGAASVGISDNVIGAAQYTLFSYPGGVVAGKNSAVPSFNLTWDGVTLGGLPKDLRGTSGSLGGKFFGNNFVTFWGGAGGAGGAGCILVARNLSIGASGRIDLSGGDGASALFTINGGAGGAPGGLLVVLDGAAATATGLTDAGFVANNGATPTNAGAVNYGPASAPLQLLFASDPTQYTSYYVGTSAASGYTRPTLSGARGGSRVQFVPGSQAVVADPALAKLAAPSSMGLSGGQAELLRATDGTIIVRVKVTWVPSFDARTVGYDLQFKRSADAVWSDAPSVIGSTTAWVAGVADGVNYDFQVRAASATREVSDWVTITGFFVVGKTAKPADVGTITYAEPVISWPPNASDDDLAGYIVRYQPSWASTDWASATPAHQQGFLTQTQYDTVALVGGQTTMLVKCVDTTGNESTNVSSKQIDLRPPVPTGFTVTRQPDGTRELAWILASPPSDLDGFRIKWFLGATSDWTAMTLLHSGVLKASPFESNQLAAGTYTFAIKSVDKAGNESATALFITSLTIGDPRIAGSIEDFLEEPFWTETKTNAILDGATGWLVASGSGSWNTEPITWDAWNSWIVTPSGSIQYERKIDVGLITTFTPLVTVVADSAGGAVTIEEAHSNVDSGYSAFAAVGPELLARWVKLRVTVTGTFPKLKSERIILSATPIEEIINDLSTSTLTGAFRIAVGDIRLPITKAYNVIKKVDITLQSVGAGWSVELIDKDKTVGPRIKIYNASNVLADALIDATVRGV